MRKFLALGAAALLVLAVATVSFAQDGVVNEYSVDASLSPTKAGSKKNPVPVSVNFDYAISANNDQRPIPVKKYSIQFSGLAVNTAVAASCQTETLEQEGLAGCPAKSLVGSGYIENATGQTANPADKSVVCNAKVTVVNEHPNKANIYVKGSPTATDDREKCAIELAAPIPANYVRTAGGTNLEFNVPTSLLHPGSPALSNAVERVQSRIKKITKRIGGKVRGYYSAAGGCKSGTRTVTVVFTPESGPTGRAQDKVVCSK
jgi:hypothetical protein